MRPVIAAFLLLPTIASAEPTNLSDASNGFRTIVALLFKDFTPPPRGSVSETPEELDVRLAAEKAKRTMQMDLEALYRDQSLIEVFWADGRRSAQRNDTSRLEDDRIYSIARDQDLRETADRLRKTIRSVFGWGKSHTVDVAADKLESAAVDYQKRLESGAFP